MFGGSLNFFLRIVDVVQFASRTNMWAADIYDLCYNEYFDLYRRLAQMYDACPR